MALRSGRSRRRVIDSGPLSGAHRDSARPLSAPKAADLRCPCPRAADSVARPRALGSGPRVAAVGALSAPCPDSEGCFVDRARIVPPGGARACRHRRGCRSGDFPRAGARHAPAVRAGEVERARPGTRRARARGPRSHRRPGHSCETDGLAAVGRHLRPRSAAILFSRLAARRRRSRCRRRRGPSQGGARCSEAPPRSRQLPEARARSSPITATGSTP